MVGEATTLMSLIPSYPGYILPVCTASRQNTDIHLPTGFY